MFRVDGTDVSKPHIKHTHEAPADHKKTSFHHGFDTSIINGNGETVGISWIARRRWRNVHPCRQWNWIHENRYKSNKMNEVFSVFSEFFIIFPSVRLLPRRTKAQKASETEIDCRCLLCVYVFTIKLKSLWTQARLMNHELMMGLFGEFR